MRRHYESLNYFDGTPGLSVFHFSRTAGAATGVLGEDGRESHFPPGMNRHLNRAQTEALRDMLTEVLEDWK